MACLLLLGCSAHPAIPASEVALPSPSPSSDGPVATRAKTKPVAYSISFQDEHGVKPVQGSCAERVETFRVSGLRDAAIERDVNRLFSPQQLAILVSFTNVCPDDASRCVPSKAGHIITCESAYGSADLDVSTTATVRYLDERLLSVELTSAGESGGVHPFYSVSGINIDLERGMIHGVDDWLSVEAETVEWFKLGAREAEDEEEPFYDLSAFEVARVDAPNLGGYSEAYFTEEALYLIPSVPEVSRHQRGNHRRVPWSEIAGYVPSGSPLRSLVDHAR